jgi:hypothetical protein
MEVKVVSFKPQPLYARRKNLGRHWVGSWMHAMEKSLFLLLEIEPKFIGCLARGLVTILTELSWQILDHFNKEVLRQKTCMFSDIAPCSPLKVNRFERNMSPPFSLLMTEATCSSETSVDFQRTTWRYIPEDRILLLVMSPRWDSTPRQTDWPSITMWLWLCEFFMATAVRTLNPVTVKISWWLEQSLLLFLKYYSV